MKSINIIPATVLAIGASLLTGCNHKDLVYDLESRSGVIVVYDWTKAPDANPASMELRMHPQEAPSKVVNFFFQNRKGGPLNAPVGDYTCVTLNGDLTDWAQTRNHEDPDAFELYTPDATAMRNLGIPSRSVPRAAGAEGERMAMTPGMVWSDRRDNIGIHNTPGVQVITFYPEELNCHYTVDIYDVSHTEYLQSPTLDATLSGMAEGVYPGRKQSTDNPVTMPFTLHTDAAQGSMHAEFLTFGETSQTQRAHTITVYLTLTDGTRWYATADVSKQIYDAPDPHHVHIVLRGIDLPKPINSTGGIIPDVDDWQTVNIDLPM